MRVYIAPFVYLAVMLGIFLFAPEERRSETQQRIRRDINFYLASELAIVLMAMVALWLYRSRWVYWFGWPAWVVTLILIGISVARVFRTEEPEPPSAFDDKA